MPDTTEVPEFEEESMLLDLDVPPVRDRDPDPQAGPRLNIKEFRLQGVVEFPELGITRKELIDRVEAIRFDLMNEGELLDSGYTIDEVGQVSDLLAEIEKKTKDEHVGPLEVQKLVFLIREQRRQRGVTLGMIETVADTITRYYRERGFILAKAYIPEQKVRDGIVTLTLLLGELGAVRVENAKRVSEKLIQRTFKSQISQPVTSWLTEENLYLVNDISGLDVQGFFQPGSQVGDTLLVVNVRNESLVTTVLRTDNHGSDKTGEYRVFADVAIHNPSGNGDELRFSGLTTFEPANTNYGSISYKSLLYFPRLQGELSYSTNDFVSRNLASSSANNFYFTGTSSLSRAELKYTIKRSRIKNHFVSFGVTNIETELATVLDNNPSTGQGDDAFVSTFTYSFDVLNQKRRHLYQGRISLNYSDVEPGETGGGVGSGGELLSTSAGFMEFDFSMLSFLTLPFTSYETRLLYKASGQYAGKGLSNVNQYSLAGPTRLRGFEVNSAQFDDALYLGVDWFLGLPKFGGAKIFGEAISRVFQPYLFIDGGYGRLSPVTDNGTDELKGGLADIGFGVKFNHRRLSGNVIASNGFLDDMPGQADVPTSGIYFDLQYVF